MDVITYPWWDENQSMLVKGAPGHARSQGINNHDIDLFLRNIQYQTPG